MLGIKILNVKWQNLLIYTDFIFFYITNNIFKRMKHRTFWQSFNILIEIPGFIEYEIKCLNLYLFKIFH